MPRNPVSGNLWLLCTSIRFLWMGRAGMGWGVGWGGGRGGVGGGVEGGDLKAGWVGCTTECSDSQGMLFHLIYYILTHTPPTFSPQHM
jgi:hypothetical protein